MGPILSEGSDHMLAATLRSMPGGKRTLLRAKEWITGQRVLLLRHGDSRLGLVAGILDDQLVHVLFLGEIFPGIFFARGLAFK